MVGGSPLTREPQVPTQQPPGPESGGWQPEPPGPAPPEPPPAPPGPPGPPPRPRLRSSVEIQGNILAAFNKDRQTFLFLRLPDGERCRTWLRELEPQIATTDEVETFNEQFSAARRARGGDDPENLVAVWVNVGFTVDGLRKLWRNSDAFQFPEGRFEAFAQRAHARAAGVGDAGESDPSRWVFGAPEQPVVDAIVTVAADRRRDLVGKLRRLRELAAEHGVVTVFEQEGETLPFGRAGHEHFGFKDGISQPGVRDFHEPDPARPDERIGHPGTKLIAPGEFIIGEIDETGQAPEAPEWMRDGSFQVFRRLSQDVPAWWAQVRQARERDLGVTEDQLAAKLVGRWRSGTPLARADERDNRSAKKPIDDNDFSYEDDPEGVKTPRFAHIRKLYPRGAFDDRRHRIMRRGIPFGRPFDPSFGRGHGVDAERGLIFNIYCADIERQFEFLQASWANNPGFPQQGDGADPVIGADPVRVTLRLRDRAEQALDFRRFVRTSGALYAFAPSKRTLQRLAAGEPL